MLITDLLKVAKLESEVKKKPELYLDLAAAYESGPRAKLSEEYTASLKPDKTETDQSKVILANLNGVIDNQIDAEARAAALTTDAGKKKEIVTELTSLYKYRNKTATDANVTELVASRSFQADSGYAGAHHFVAHAGSIFHVGHDWRCESSADKSFD